MPNDIAGRPIIQVFTVSEVVAAGASWIAHERDGLFWALAIYGEYDIILTSLSFVIRGRAEKYGHAWRSRDRCGDPWRDQDALVMFCSYTCL